MRYDSIKPLDRLVCQDAPSESFRTELLVNPPLNNNDGYIRHRNNIKKITSFLTYLKYYLSCNTAWRVRLREGELRPAKGVGQTRGLLDLVEDDYLLEGQKQSGTAWRPNVDAINAIDATLAVAVAIYMSFKTSVCGLQWRLSLAAAAVRTVGQRKEGEAGV